ncbi:hypothetical protein E2C01_053482 [Portunus trituberculatus]|uniref:Uncharacterized protein n=1 Tax=Portunus trituberculatus TaxID=210409 RepID=A0A5B7GPH2_PORTR|nr:hypothetical protein [Portunus trituberculatus]
MLAPGRAMGGGGGGGGGLVLSGVPSVLVIMRCRVGVIDLFVILFTLPQTSIIPAMGGAATGAAGACCRI